MSSLYIHDAVLGRANDQISEETYLRCIIDHATGLRHGANELCNGDSSDEIFSNLSEAEDPFAWVMTRNWIGRSGLYNYTEGSYNGSYEAVPTPATISLLMEFQTQRLCMLPLWHIAHVTRKHLSLE